jgi:3-methyladenine DNA glycosylase AlkD
LLDHRRQQCGDDHGVDLSAVRAVAKRLKTQHELANELWATGDTAARPLATLIASQKLPNNDFQKMP